MPQLKILYFNSPKYDITTALHIEGLLQHDDVEIRFTSLGNYAPQNQVLSKKEATRYGRHDADVLVLGSRPYVDSDTFWKIGKGRGQLRVRMEGGDEAALGVKGIEFYKFDLIFKRELYRRSWSKTAFRYSMLSGSAGLWRVLAAHHLIPFPFYHSMGNAASLPVQARNILRNLFWLPGNTRVRPFPFGIEKRMRGTFNREPSYELSCIIRPHTRDRERLVSFFRKKGYPKMFVGTIKPLPEDVSWMVDHGACHPGAVKLGGVGLAQNRAYFNQINNSRACLSIPGGGFDTLRFWEILAQGSLLISKRIAIEMPFPLLEGKHYVGFDTLKELEEILEWLYLSPNEADVIRKSGQKFSLKYHSSYARAECFLKSVMSYS